MDAIETGKEIRRAVDTGKVLFGSKESEYALKHGEGQLLVLTQNAPALMAENLVYVASLTQVPVYTFPGNGLSLGSVCGKPYVISALLVLDEGKSKVTALATKKEETPSPSSSRGRKKKAAR